MILILRAIRHQNNNNKHISLANNNFRHNRARSGEEPAQVAMIMSIEIVLLNWKVLKDIRK
jgi:hypothetical protein